MILFCLIKYQYKKTQYNMLIVKFSSSQLNNLKSVIKNETEVILALSSNLIGNFEDETNFLHN